MSLSLVAASRSIPSATRGHLFDRRASRAVVSIISSFLVLSAGRAHAEEFVGGARGSGIGRFGSAAIDFRDAGVLQSSIAYITPYGERDAGPTVCLAAKGGRADDGTPVVLAPCDGTTAQSFRLLPSGDLRGVGDKCVNPSQPGVQSGAIAPAVLGPCGIDGALAWDWGPDGWLSVGGGLCLSAPTGATGRSAADDGGIPLDIEACDGTDRQSWMVHANMRINSGDYCLQTDDSGLMFYLCSGDPNQTWVFSPAGWILSWVRKYVTAFLPQAAGGIVQSGVGVEDFDVPYNQPDRQLWSRLGGALESGAGGCLANDVTFPFGDGGARAVVATPCGAIGGEGMGLASPLTVGLVAAELPSWDAPTTAQMLLSFAGRGAISQCGLVSSRLANVGAVRDAGAACCAASPESVPPRCRTPMSVGDLLDDQGYSFAWSPVPLSPAMLQAEIGSGHPVPFELVLPDQRSVAMLVVGFTTTGEQHGWLTVNDPGNSQFGISYDRWASPERFGEAWAFSGNYFDIQLKN